MEQRQHRKHKPKPKVSQLDETAAQRRRAQASRAQRAFRQRKEDTIASLNAQIAGLHRTIEDLNACFLTLTDELVASGWLERDLQVTKTVQGTIERFIAAVRASHAPEKENQVVSDDHDPDSIARGPLAQEVDLDRSHDAGTLEHGLIVAQSGGSTAPYEATYQASNFQSFPGELVLPHVNITHTFNFMTQLPIPGSIGPSSPTFAQRLNLEAIRAGLRLVCSAEDRSLDFYRVFNHVLDFHARERLRRLLNRILDHNFHQLLQPPPESDVDGQGSGALPSAWLNASDVARYFRTIGIDLDGSQDIVTVQMHRGSLPARLLSVQGLPARDLVKVRRGGFEGSPHQQRSYDQAYLSSTPRHHFTSATRDVSSFGIFDKHLGYTAQSHDMLDISIDVSKLIYEIVLGTRCLDKHPSFNRGALDDALARAVIKTHKPKWVA